MTNLNIKQTVGAIKQSIDLDISKQIKEASVKDIANFMAHIVGLNKTQEATNFIYRDKTNTPYYSMVEERIVSEILQKVPRSQMRVSYKGYEAPVVTYNKSDMELDFPELEVENPKMAAILQKYKTPEFIQEVVEEMNLIGNYMIKRRRVDSNEVTRKIAQAVSCITYDYPGFSIDAKVFVDSDVEDSISVNILPALLNADKETISLILSEASDSIVYSQSREDINLLEGRSVLFELASKDKSAMGSPFVDAIDLSEEKTNFGSDFVDITVDDSNQLFSVLSNLRPDAIEHLQETAPEILKNLETKKLKKSNSLEF